jgi:prepilin-type N-terminal cleavage/methylation domain-containing protein
MNRERPHGFTLIEMLTVMAVIGILAALIIGTAGLVQHNAAVKRAEGEIAGMSLAIQNYYNENGDYPRTNKTDELDPRMDGNPATGATKEKYEDANIDLYSRLSGDYEPDNHPDFKPEKKGYYEFKPNNLGTKKDSEQKIKEVEFISDPWGNCYGYSTARSKAEREYEKDVRKRADTARPTSMPGYNKTFDLWSTGGSTRSATQNGEQIDVKKWVKNW